MESRFVRTPESGDHIVPDSKWAGEARAAVGCAGLLLALSLTVDAVDAGLTLGSAAMWIALSVALFVILLPARVVAAPGRVTVHGLWTRQTVRTDRLATVSRPDGIEQRLVMSDTDGGRAEIHLRVLLANPPLWLLVEAGARFSAENGTLLSGADALDRLARRVERDTAHTVFMISHLH
ncbi:hypothetical protein ACFW9O_12000 [Streptomyces sp. NPDC059499]|uniref:hypothetical protein n=1 Tax=Streptomyces sp. NPDC059499 TaxID=3346852 RepID=UPI003697BE15